MGRNYHDDVSPILLKSPCIELFKKDAQYIYEFAKAFQNAKASETLHKIDNDQELKRYMTGFAAEYALEKFLGIEFMDRSFGNSDDYNTADLKSVGINIGVKCSNHGNYPTVFIKPKTAEIITVLKGVKVYICGVASIKTLTDYSDPDLILSDKLRARNVKTGFYGFDQLIAFKNVEELRAISRNQPKQHVKPRF